MSDDVLGEVLAEISGLYREFDGLTASPNIFATRLLRIWHEILIRDTPADPMSLALLQGVAAVERAFHDKTMERYARDVSNIKAECCELIHNVRFHCTNRPSNTVAYESVIADASKYKLSRYILAHELHCKLMDFLLTVAYLATKLSVVEASALLVYFKFFIGDLVDIMGHYVELNTDTANARERVVKAVQEIVHNYNVMYESRNERPHFDALDAAQNAYCNARMVSNDAFDHSSEILQFIHKQKGRLFVVFMFGRQNPYVKGIVERISEMTLKLLEILADISTLDALSKTRHEDALRLPNATRAKQPRRTQPGNLAKASHVFECAGLTFKVGSDTLFQDVHVSIYNRQWTMFYGNSGCGKTAFVHILMRQVDISPHTHLAGEIRYLGKRADYEYDDIRDDLSYVAASGDMFQASISYNMLYGVPDDRKPLATKYLSLFGMRHMAGRLEDSIDVLSTGETQRIRIIRMILQNKRIWLIDEATSNIDNRTENVILGCLRRIQRQEKKAVIHITHNADNRRFADRTLSIQRRTIAYTNEAT
jgi:putative ABC transport system ATP-binding protein